MKTAQPDFDIDLKHGKAAEDLLAHLLFTPGALEVKRQDRAAEFGTLFIETACDKGKRGDYQPSGLSVTRAEYWVIFVKGLAFWIPVVWLRNKQPSCRLAECRDGNCPTKGWRLPLLWLIRGQ